MITIDNKKCSGCGACSFVCPVHAITMHSDNGGFRYPIISLDSCINCHRCEKVCAYNDKILKNPPISYYLAKNNCKEVCLQSTSGGAYTAISNYFLESQNVVYAATFDSNLNIVHERIFNKEQRDYSRGSKYVQSNIEDCFSSILNDLKEERKVCFVGTPCQVYAVKQCVPAAYLSNLFLIDLVCNGVGSPGVWKKYIYETEKKYGKKIYKYIFRPKTKGYLTGTEVIVFKDGTTKEIINPLKRFNQMYYDGLITRENCSNCKFTTIERVSDITIGDYAMAREKFPNFDSKYGASMILVNTMKGQEIFENIKDELTYTELTQCDCAHGRLIESSTMNFKSNSFIKDCHDSVKSAKNKYYGLNYKLKMLIASMVYRGKHR